MSDASPTPHTVDEGTSVDKCRTPNGLNKTRDILKCESSWQDILNDSFGHTSTISIHATELRNYKSEFARPTSPGGSIVKVVFSSLSADWLRVSSLPNSVSGSAGRSSAMSSFIEDNNSKYNESYLITEERLRKHNQEEDDIIPIQREDSSSSSRVVQRNFRDEAERLQQRREIRGGFGTPSSYASEQEMNLYFKETENDSVDSISPETFSDFDIEKQTVRSKVPEEKEIQIVNQNSHQMEEIIESERVIKDGRNSSNVGDSTPQNSKGTEIVIALSIDSSQSNLEHYELEENEPLNRMLKTAEEAVNNLNKSEAFIKNIISSDSTVNPINNLLSQNDGYDDSGVKKPDIKDKKSFDNEATCDNVYVTDIKCLNKERIDHKVLNSEENKENQRDDVIDKNLGNHHDNQISIPTNCEKILNVEEQAIEKNASSIDSILSMSDSLIEDIFDKSVADIRKEIEKNKNKLGLGCAINIGKSSVIEDSGLLSSEEFVKNDNFNGEEIGTIKTEKRNNPKNIVTPLSAVSDPSVMDNSNQNEKHILHDNMSPADQPTFFEEFKNRLELNVPTEEPEMDSEKDEIQDGKIDNKNKEVVSVRDIVSEISIELINIHVESNTDKCQYPVVKKTETEKDAIVRECVEKYTRSSHGKNSIVSSLNCDTDESSEYFSLPDPDALSARTICSEKDNKLGNFKPTLVEKSGPKKNYTSTEKSGSGNKVDKFSVKDYKETFTLQPDVITPNKLSTSTSEENMKKDIEMGTLFDSTEVSYEFDKNKDNEYYQVSKYKTEIRVKSPPPDVNKDTVSLPKIYDRQWLIGYAPTYQAVLEWEPENLSKPLLSCSTGRSDLSTNSLSEIETEKVIRKINFEKKLEKELEKSANNLLKKTTSSSCNESFKDCNSEKDLTSIDTVSECGSYITGEVIDKETVQKLQKSSLEKVRFITSTPTQLTELDCPEKWGTRSVDSSSYASSYQQADIGMIYIPKYQNLEDAVDKLFNSESARSDTKPPFTSFYSSTNKSSETTSNNNFMDAALSLSNGKLNHAPIPSLHNKIDSISNIQKVNKIPIDAVKTDRDSSLLILQEKALQKRKHQGEMINEMLDDVTQLREELRNQLEDLVFCEQRIRIWRNYQVAIHGTLERNETSGYNSSGYGHSRTHHIQEDIDSLKREVRNRETEIDGLVKLLREAKEENRKMERKLNDSSVDEYRINDLKQEKQEFYEKIRYQKEEISKLKDKIEDLSREKNIALANEKLARDNLNAEKEIRSVLRSSPPNNSYEQRKTMEQLHNRLRDLEETNKSSTGELNQTEYLLESLRNENRELRRSQELELSNLKADNSKMRDKLDRMTELSAENLLLAADSADLQGELTELRREARDLRSRCHDLSEENRQLKMEVRDLRRYIEAINKNKTSDPSQGLVDKIEYYQAEHDRLLEEVRRLKMRVGDISPRSRSPMGRSPRACSPPSPRVSPRSSPCRSRNLSPSKGVRFNENTRGRPGRSATTDAMAAATAAGLAGERVDDGRISPSLALNFRDLTMDRYNQHLEGGRGSPDSLESDSTDMLLNPPTNDTREIRCAAKLNLDMRDNNLKSTVLSNGLKSGSRGSTNYQSRDRSCDKRRSRSRSPQPILGGSGYRSISPRQHTTQRSKPKVEYPPEINRSLPRRAFAPRSPADLKNGYAIKFTRPGGKISRGTVRYIGHLPARSEVYLGVELDAHDGKHCGTFQGSKYFSCPPNKGVFTPFGKVIMAWE